MTPSVTGISSSMVSVAQSVERWIVAPVVVGSIPITHPIPKTIVKDKTALRGAFAVRALATQSICPPPLRADQGHL